MPEYLAPGVYVEEVSGGAKPIEAVGTSTACIIGFTEKARQPKVVDGQKQFDEVIGKPIFITSWEEYEETFGRFVPGFYTPLSVYAFFQNGGKRCYVVSLREIPKASRNIISRGKGENATHKEFLKIESRIPGEDGEALRTTIEALINPQLELHSSAWKFKLKVREAASSALASAPVQQPETHTITLQQKGKDKVSLQSVPANPASALLEITTIKEVDGEIAAAWPKADNFTESVELPFEHKIGDATIFTIKRKEAGTADGPLAVKLATKVTNGKIEITVTAESALAAAPAVTQGEGALEETEFEMYESEENGKKVVRFRPLEPQSTLIDLQEIDSASPPEWSLLEKVRPTDGGQLSLDNANGEQNISAQEPDQKLLKVKAKKSGADFRPLTITVAAPNPQAAESAATPEADGTKVEGKPNEEPTFVLKVERLHPVSNKWELKERRVVTLKKESAVKTDTNGAETPREVLKVEYLSQRPTYVDLLVLKPEQDVKDFSLHDLWPETQTATLTPAPVKLAITDKNDLGPAPYSAYQGSDMKRTGIGGLAEIDDINFICMPDLMRAWSDKQEDQKYVQSVQALAIAHCDLLKNRMVILDPPKEMNPQQIKKWRMDEARYDSSRAVLYYPWVEVMDPASNKTTFLPPSGFVAGVWARNDTNRGVHKAPANEVVQLAVGLQYEVGQGHQELLNPIGINCIRPLRGMGIRVWGARTLSQSDPEWKYVNVRRLFHMIEQSIQRSTMWAVFEPNDHRLWAKLRRDVRNFLMTLYSQGMLFGATPGQAFFVKCDEDNNPKFTRDLGQVIVDVGVAPVKPAEFVIFRIRQWSPEDDQG